MNTLSEDSLKKEEYFDKFLRDLRNCKFKDSSNELEIKIGKRIDIRNAIRRNSMGINKTKQSKKGNLTLLNYVFHHLFNYLSIFYFRQ